MYTQRSHDKTDTQRNNQGRQFLNILDKETMNLGGLDRIKETVWEFSLVRNSKWNLD